MKISVLNIQVPFRLTPCPPRLQHFVDGSDLDGENDILRRQVLNKLVMQ